LHSNSISKAESGFNEKTNPKFIRNYLLYQCIEEINAGKTAMLMKLTQALENPYQELFRNFPSNVLLAMTLHRRMFYTHAVHKYEIPLSLAFRGKLKFRICRFSKNNNTVASQVSLLRDKTLDAYLETERWVYHHPK
jgi:hypothetical protein